MFKYKIIRNVYLTILLFAAGNLFSQTSEIAADKIQEARGAKIDHLHLPFSITENGVVDSVIYKTIDRYEDLRTHKETYTFDGDSRLYFTFDEIWDPDSNKWIDYSTDSIAFDEKGNTVLKLGKIWNGEEWENWWKSEYNYEDGVKQSWQYYN